MKERPILFSAPMVRAILAGTKTQTRRIVKHHRFGFPSSLLVDGSFIWAKFLGSPFPDMLHSLKCPYGTDELWVRETFHYDNAAYVSKYEDAPWLGMPDAGTAETYYRASEANPDIFPKWTPSIFMPRWASRITLAITDARVERLQEISDEDAIAEGAHRKIWITSPISAGAMGARGERGTHRDGYKEIWEGINGDGSWALNPWVWVISFRVLPR